MTLFKIAFALSLLAGALIWIGYGVLKLMEMV